MEQKDRQRIVSVLTAQIEPTGSMRFGKIRQVFQEEGIDPAVFGGQRPKRFIMDNFPEFIIEGSNGMETISMAKLTPNQRQMLADGIQREIDRVGLMWCASVPELMRQRGLPEWRTLVRPGENLIAWLKRSFPEFCHGMKNGGAAIFSLDAGEAGDQLSPDEAELKQQAAPLQRIVLNFVLIPMSLPLLRQFQGLCGSELRMVALRSLCVRRIGRYLLGETGGVLDDSAARTPRLAVPLERETPKGQHIYCVLAANTRKDVPVPWYLDGLCYPGQEDEKGYGRWLCQTFGLPNEETEQGRPSCDALRARIQELEELGSQLSAQLEGAGEALREGRALPETFQAQVTGYTEGWKRLRGELSEGLLPLPAGEQTLSGILSLLDSQGALAGQLEELSAAYAALVQGCWHYLTENWLCAQDGSDRDLQAWRELCGSLAWSSGAADSVQKLLRPFQAVRELTRERAKFDAAAAEAAALVNGHFGAELTPPTVKMSFCRVMESDPEKLAFLNHLDLIGGLLSRMEVKPSGSRPSAPFPPDGADLLERAAQGSCSLGEVLTGFEAPDLLDSAVMLGQTETVRALIDTPGEAERLGLTAAELEAALETMSEPEGSVTLCSAGRRLWRALGGRRGQAERCFLTALLLGEPEAVSGLLDVYRGEGRIQEVLVLFDRWRDAMDGRIWRGCMDCLLPTGVVDVGWAVGEDVLYFLSPQVIARLKKLGEETAPPQTVRLLEEIAGQLEVPFVRHVVFLSSELQNYILQPENTAVLQELGVDRPLEQLISVAKGGQYPKGRDPLSTARRVYDFIGAWGGLSQALLALAPDSSGSYELMLKLLQEEKDEERLLQMLRRDPRLLDAYGEEYGELLFAREAYVEFLTRVGAIKEPSLRLRLQAAVASVITGCWDGELPQVSEGELEEAMPLLLRLERALVEGEHLDQLFSLQLSLFEPILRVCREEEVRRFVTVDGALAGPELSRLQARAAEGGCTALAVYCGSVLGLGTQTIQAQAQTCFRTLMDQTARGNAQERQEAVRLIQLLFREEYESNQAELFPIRLQAILKTLPSQEGTAGLTNMLTPTLSRAALETMLNTLEASGRAGELLADPGLCQRLEQVCRERGMQQELMCFLHRHREDQGEEWTGFLARLYLESLEKGSFPPELLDEAEDYLLQRLARARTLTPASCVYRMERLRGRQEYGGFALLYLLGQSEQEELEQWVREELDRLPPEAPRTELGLFSRVLAWSAQEVFHYLSFCRCFGLLTAAQREEASLMTQGYATEAESVLLLHYLYSEWDNSRGWRMCCRLPLQAQPQLYARLLYCGAAASEGGSAQSGDVTWKRCVDYCRENDQADILLEALLAWLQELLARGGETMPWYVSKECMTVVGEFSRKGDCPESWTPERTRPLIEALCQVFQRINAGTEGDANHTSLRSIVEIAVMTGQEDILLQSGPILESLLGLNRKLGLALALRLLQAGRTEKASSLLRQLARLQDGMPYLKLLRDVAEKSPAELEQWRQEPAAQSLIEFILPDGNSLNGLSLRTLVLKHLLEGQSQVGIQVVEELLRNDEHDCMSYVALFILCKKDYAHNIPRIYRALAGVFRNYAVDEWGVERSWCYTRPRAEVFRLLLITRAVMERLGLPIPEEDRNLNDFLGASSLFIRSGREDKTRFVQNHINLYHEVSGKFSGYDEEGTRLWVEALMGCVTGVWEPLLRRAYQRKLPGSCYLSCAAYNSWGLLRGVLLVLRSLPGQERRLFLNWLENSVGDLGPASKRIWAVCKTAGTLSTVYKLDGLDQQMLELPWEEHFVCLGDLRDLNAPGITSCYRWMQENTPTAQLRDTLPVFCHLGQDVLKAQVMYSDADKLFLSGADAQAEVYYRVMERSLQERNEKNQLYPKRASELTEGMRREYRELYYCRSRISGSFAGSEWAVGSLKNPQFKGQSCYNMLVVLLSTRRAVEVHRLARYFTGDNRRLCIQILKLVSPKTEDGEKLAIFQSFQGVDGVAEGLAALLCSKGADGRYLFLRDVSSVKQVEAGVPRQPVRPGSEPPFYLRLTAVPAAFPQTESAPELESQQETRQRQQSGQIPSFALEAQRGSGGKTEGLEQLQRQYRDCGRMDYRRKAELSGQIYCLLRQAEDTPASQLNQSLVQYGLDYFAYHTWEDGEGDSALAFRAQRELAVYCEANHLSGGAGQQFVERVPFALQRMLNSFTSVDELVEDYLRDSRGYDALTSFVEGKLPFLTGIFGAIRSLSRTYCSLDGPKLQNADNYKTAYVGAITALDRVQISRQEYGEAWGRVKNHLLTLLFEAQNALDQRPDLSVVVLNHRNTGLRRGAICGELQNTGREKAADIVLQAVFMDARSSCRYRYANLLPGEKVAFAVDYDAVEGASTLEYTLNVTYSHDQREMSCDAVKGTLTIVPEGPLEFATNLYQSDRPSEFTVDQTGQVVGEGFFGREQQMRQLREIVAGRRFASYTNTVVQGIRRSGKTSLLNYLEAYIKAKRPHVAVVRTDCEGVSDQYVQRVFVDSVLRRLALQLPGLAEHDLWSALASQWTLPQGAPDRAPTELQYFYLDLKRTLEAAGEGDQERGLLLVVDEVDVLLQKLELENGLDNVLLQSLRSITQDSACRQAVHFVLCGSNNLMKYKRDGGRYHQLFQDFHTIEVDALPQADLEAMLRTPYADDQEVVLPPQTLDWVRRYTGGLVWYTKLLGKAMLDVAKSNGRGAVYPSDVCQAFSGVCKKEYCLQFYEGCGELEFHVLDAMARLAERYQSYVSFERLRPAVGDVCSEGQLSASLELLLELKLIEQDASGRSSYRFKREIYRRFFRSQLVSTGEVRTVLGDMMEKQVSLPKGYGVFDRPAGRSEL